LRRGGGCAIEIRATFRSERDSVGKHKHISKLVLENINKLALH